MAFNLLTVPVRCVQTAAPVDSGQRRRNEGAQHPHFGPDQGSFAAPSLVVLHCVGRVAYSSRNRPSFLAFASERRSRLLPTPRPVRAELDFEQGDSWMNCYKIDRFSTGA